MGFFSGLGSALIGGAASLLGGSSQNKASAKEAGASRLFTKEQMQNKHQWEVEDLKKAGLNPVLSAHSAGAIGPSAMASQPFNPGEAVSSAMMVKKFNAEIDNIKEDTKKKEAEKYAVDVMGRQNMIKNKLLKSQVPGAKIEAELDSGKSGRMNRFLRRFIPFLNAAPKYNFK